jgi:hypothetical protein
VTSPKTIEKALRMTPDAYPAWAIVVDGSSAEAVRAALTQVVPEPTLGKADLDLLQLVFQAVSAS